MQSETSSSNISENRVYDEFGNLTIVYTTDSDFDALPESIFTYTYDTQGKLISQTQDLDGDGGIDSVTTANYRYDASGNLTIDYATDSNRDGQADRVLSYTFNPQGEQISTYDSLETEPTSSPDSPKADANEHEIEPPAVVQPLALSSRSPGFGNTSSTYNLAGLVTRTSVSNIGGSAISFFEYDEFDNLIFQDASGGRGFSVSYINTYDDANNLRQISVDPTFLSFEPYLSFQAEYDSAGNLTKQVDYGTPILAADSQRVSGYNTIVTSIFDENGNLVKELRDASSAQGVPADGTPDSIRLFTYDSNSNLIREDVDENADGAVDRTAARYTYNEQNREVRAALDTDSNGTLDYVRVSTYTLDSEDNFTRELVVEEAQGGKGDVYTFSYDSRGNPIEETINGGVTLSQENFYNEAGNLTSSFRRDQFSESSTTYGVRIVGTDGKNILVGTAEGDILIGKGGDDRLDGTDGEDLLLGGAGRDTFVISATLSTILDFSSQEDIIEIQSLTDSFDDLIFEGSKISIFNPNSGGFNDPLVIVEGIDTATLTPDQFVFV